MFDSLQPIRCSQVKAGMLTCVNYFRQPRFLFSWLDPAAPVGILSFVPIHHPYHRFESNFAGTGNVRIESKPADRQGLAPPGAGVSLEPRFFFVLADAGEDARRYRGIMPSGEIIRPGGKPGNADDHTNMTIHEEHRAHRVGWLRAAVLGANDGIVSTASLIVGVAAADTTQDAILLAGVAGLVAGAMSMAAGEYVSVSSQADTEQADLELEKRSLEENPEFERDELAEIYVQRGLSPQLAGEVAAQLMAHDALETHARDEIGITEGARARPIQAALASLATFTLGAALPLLTAWAVPRSQLIAVVAMLSIVFLAILGGIAARAGGAPVLRASIRVSFWGALAMGLTAGVGRLFGVVA